MDEVKERPYVDDDDYYVLCTLKNKTESRL